MSDRPTHPADIDLKIREAETVLDLIRKQPCSWQWPVIESLLTRLERLIAELRQELRDDAAYGAPMVDLVEHVVQWLVREHPDLDTTFLRELAGRAEVELNG